MLFYIHYGLLLAFGVFMSFSFSGCRISKRSGMVLVLTFLGCGLLQSGVYLLLSEEQVWLLYPLIVHLPLVLVLHLYLKKPLVTAVAAVSTAYLCCQPANWIGLLLESITENSTVVHLAQIAVILITAAVCILFFGAQLAGLFNKDRRSVVIFGIVPVVYYLFDYGIGIYSDVWLTHTHLVGQFLAFFLCIIFMVFCAVYYRQYEQRVEAQQRERLISVQVQQQAQRMEKTHQSEQVVRMLRHDMRHFLSTLAVCLENGNSEKALELVQGYLDYADQGQLKKYCENDMINYVLTDFADRCDKKAVKLHCTVELEQVIVDEIELCVVLANALENALVHQPDQGDRYVRVMLKNMDGRLLISVKNPVDRPPRFADGMPIATREHHGYGTQSIRYMTGKLGGNCQFCVQNGIFIARVVI